MAISFITGSELNTELEYLIKNAEQYLFLICPYIKLHERLKFELKSKKECHSLKIIVVFGKNPEGIHKSFSKQDFEFLMDFPNVEIRYEERLHAKYYANDRRAIITSMNLYDYSQNNNIEVGVLLDVKSLIGGLGDIVLQQNDPEYNALEYFEKVIKNANLYYKREPNYKKGMLGLSSEYISSEVKIDVLSEKYNILPVKTIKTNPKPDNKQDVGYCIRTGKTILFNIKLPYSDSAYQSWKRFSNPDYEEKFCHFSGEESKGETSFKSPILRKNWKVAKAKFGF